MIRYGVIGSGMMGVEHIENIGRDLAVCHGHRDLLDSGSAGMAAQAALWEGVGDLDQVLGKIDEPHAVVVD